MLFRVENPLRDSNASIAQPIYINKGRVTTLAGEWLRFAIQFKSYASASTIFPLNWLNLLLMPSRSSPKRTPSSISSALLYFWLALRAQSCSSSSSVKVCWLSSSQPPNLPVLKSPSFFTTSQALFSRS